MTGDATALSPAVDRMTPLRRTRSALSLTDAEITKYDVEDILHVDAAD